MTWRNIQCTKRGAVSRRQLSFLLVNGGHRTDRQTDWRTDGRVVTRNCGLLWDRRINNETSASNVGYCYYGTLPYDVPLENVISFVCPFVLSCLSLTEQRKVVEKFFGKIFSTICVTAVNLEDKRSKARLLGHAKLIYKMAFYARMENRWKFKFHAHTTHYIHAYMYDIVCMWFLSFACLSK